MRQEGAATVEAISERLYFQAKEHMDYHTRLKEMADEKAMQEVTFKPALVRSKSALQMRQSVNQSLDKSTDGYVDPLERMYEEAGKSRQQVESERKLLQEVRDRGASYTHYTHYIGSFSP